MVENIRITGGASPEVTAAISAIVAAIETEESLAASVQPKPIHQSQWKRVGRSSLRVAPIRSGDQSQTASPSRRDV